MKKTIILLSSLFFLFSVKAQESTESIENYKKNTSAGLMFFIPFPTLKALNFSQERYIKENISLNANWSYLSTFSDGGWLTHTITIGTKIYLNSKNNVLRKYWIYPNLLWKNRYANYQNYGSKINYYHVGLSIGKRRYFKNERIFWDIGIGLSYGIGIYKYYSETFNGEAPDVNSHSNVFGFYPRFILNFGCNY